MYTPSAFLWALLAILFLLIAGTMVYEIYVLTTLQGDSSNTLFAPTVAAIALTSTALLALIVGFVAYTAMTYNRGNWLKSIVQGSQAKYERAVERTAEIKARLSATQQRMKDLSKIALNPKEYNEQLNELKRQEEYARNALIEAEVERMAAKNAAAAAAAATPPAPLETTTEKSKEDAYQPIPMPESKPLPKPLPKPLAVGDVSETSSSTSIGSSIGSSSGSSGSV